MNNIRGLVVMVLAVTLLGGCMTAEERAAIERQRQEQIAQREKERQERLAQEERERKERLAQEERERKERLAQEERERKERHAQLQAQEKERLEKEAQEAADKEWNDLAQKSYKNALDGKCKDIKNWVMIVSDEAKRTVENFAEEFMPNAFARYEKARDKALEIQQTFNEEFPSSVSRNADTYMMYTKVLERLAKARMEYYRAHQEIAHYYFEHKCGIVMSEELAKVDAKPIRILIRKFDLEEVKFFEKIKTLDAKQDEFAAKFMPQTYTQYQGWCKDYAQTEKLDREIFEERRKIDAFIDESFAACVYKLQMLAAHINRLIATYEDLYIQHRVGDKDADQLAKLDADMAQSHKTFVEHAPNMMRSAVTDLSSLFSFGMVSVPGRNIKIGETEVTQFQWVMVMGKNPSKYKGVANPVENVSWKDCQVFIKKLNIICGAAYRLPLESEWEYACRAGSTGDWGKRRNGEEGPLGAMGWYDENRKRFLGAHPVAQKEPNAWGVYDMHGNVWEWCEDRYDIWYRVCRGGGYNNIADNCSASRRGGGYPDFRGCDSSIGFRLVAD